MLTVVMFTTLQIPPPPPPPIFQLGLGNILPIDALAMDARTEEGTRGEEKGKAPV